MAETTQTSNPFVFSKQTSITTALAVALCGGAFWLGQVSQSLQLQISNQASIQEIEQKRQEDKNEAFKLWGEKLEGVIEKLADIQAEQERRIGRLEDSRP